MKINGLQELNL